MIHWANTTYIKAVRGEWKTLCVIMKKKRTGGTEATRPRISIFDRAITKIIIVRLAGPIFLSVPGTTHVCVIAVCRLACIIRRVSCTRQQAQWNLTLPELGTGSASNRVARITHSLNNNRSNNRAATPDT